MRIPFVLLAALAGTALVPALGGARDLRERHGRGGFVATGTLEPGDVDHFDVRLREGDLLTAALLDADGGEFHDPMLGVFAPSSAGTPVARNDDGGPGFLPRLALRAQESGVYRVAVTGFGDDDFDGVGHAEHLRYRLVVGVASDPLRVERPAGGRGASADLLRLRRGVAVVSGRLAPGDVDRFELRLDSDAELTASLFEPDAGEFHDPVLRLRDPGGRLLAENDDGGPGFLANLAFDAHADGRGRRPFPVLLEVTGFDPDGAGPATPVEDFSYELVVSLDHLE